MTDPIISAVGGEPTSETVEKYGGGLDHDYDAARETTAMEETHSPTVENGPQAFGEERHPHAYIATPLGDGPPSYFERIEVESISRCGCGLYQITGRVEQFPSEGKLVLQVYGTREGDSDTVAISVESANPLTLTVREESGTLYRWTASGCLVCGNGGGSA
jgi:hypothetical protein